MYNKFLTIDRTVSLSMHPWDGRVENQNNLVF